MIYTGYQLLWFFLIYSFAGWIGEVAAAVVKHHKFVNRGFVTSPVCPIYGIGAVTFAVFLPDLMDHIFFLFLGGMILASFIEYMTGKGLHALTGKKWWDYSDMRLNLEGYICFLCSAVWGICAIIAMKAGNPVICRLIRFVPKPMGWVIVWGSCGVLAADFLGSLISVLGWKKNERISQLKEGLGKTSKLLENALTHSIQNRIMKAFPAIRKKEEEQEGVFAYGCSLYKLLLIFFVTSVLGDLVETVFMLITTGRLVCRSSVVYGPFSLVWGIACVLATLTLYQFRNRNDHVVFLWGTVLGGAYEYICSVLTEVLFGAVFWNYSGFAFNLGGRINLLFCFFWGFASVIWIKWAYPWLSDLIEKIPRRLGRLICNLLAVFMAVDIVISCGAIIRYRQRADALEPRNAVESLIDGRFPDSRMEKIYPYMRFR